MLLKHIKILIHRCLQVLEVTYCFLQNSKKICKNANPACHLLLLKRQRALVQLKNAAAGMLQHKAFLVSVARQTKFGNTAVVPRETNHITQLTRRGSCRGGSEALNLPFSCPLLLSPLTTVFATSTSSCSARKPRSRLLSS